jgi:hypothetical protein
VQTPARRFGLSIAVGLLVALAAAPRADAAASVEAGWWTAAPIALAPDAPADGLVVQGSPDPAQPLSYAAIAYELAPGEGPLSLTLTVAAGSASTPNASLALCPLTGSFIPSNGGPMADAPTYDCATRVTASPTEGPTYQFDVTGLHALGALSLAVVPAGATDRVVLAKPGTEALQTIPGAPGGTAPATDPLASIESLGDPTPVENGLPFESSSLSEVAAPAPGSTSSPAAAATGADRLAAPRPFGGDDDGSLLAAALLGVLVVLAVGLWRYAGAPRDANSVAAT